MKPPPAPSSYVADDARITTASLELLRTPDGQRLIAAVQARLANAGAVTVADVAALRKTFDAAAVHAALALVQLQPRAREKFPALPWVWAVPEALEQATDQVVARHKARRYRDAGATEIWDLCAGIGGDTMALADVAPVTAVDLSAPRLTCLKWNLESAPPRFQVSCRASDLQKTVPFSPPAGSLFHMDPARRSAGKRSAAYEDLIPGPAVLADVMGRFPGGGLKLSPAVAFNTLPPGHLELISHRRVVVQAMLWVGTLADRFAGTRTATVLSDPGEPFSLTGEPVPVVTAKSASLEGGILYEVDGALTRAGLAGLFASREQLAALTTDGGYLWGQRQVVHPALVGFAVDRVVAFSVERVGAALQDVGGEPGVVEVKTRGGLPGVDTDDLQRKWTKSAPVRRTVLIFQDGKRVAAAIGRRLARGGLAHES